MENSEFEKWYNKANEEMQIPRLDDKANYHDHREKQWTRLRKSIRKPNSSSSVWLFAAASILIIGLFLTTTYQLLRKTGKDTQITYSTGKGQTEKIILPDGSTLYLYEESTVRLDTNTWTSDRTLKLAEGHLFVDVKPDAHHPFRIHTDQLQIRVLGTSFWVRNYSQEMESEITVKSGKVEVKDNNGYKNILKHGEKLTYSSKDQKITIKENQLVQVEEDFVLIYKDEKLARILADLERRYNQQLTIDTDIALDERYTISFDKQLSLAECLEKLYIIGGINIKQQQHHPTY